MPPVARPLIWILSACVHCNSFEWALNATCRECFIKERGWVGKEEEEKDWGIQLAIHSVLIKFHAETAEFLDPVIYINFRWKIESAAVVNCPTLTCSSSVVSRASLLRHLSSLFWLNQSTAQGMLLGQTSALIEWSSSSTVNRIRLVLLDPVMEKDSIILKNTFFP